MPSRRTSRRNLWTIGATPPRISSRTPMPPTRLPPSGRTRTTPSLPPTCSPPMASRPRPRKPITSPHSSGLQTPNPSALWPTCWRPAGARTKPASCWTPSPSNIRMSAKTSNRPARLGASFGPQPRPHIRPQFTSQSVGESSGLGMFESRPWLLPLPRGEGRGEGGWLPNKTSARKPIRAPTSY